MSKKVRFKSIIQKGWVLVKELHTFAHVHSYKKGVYVLSVFFFTFFALQRYLCPPDAAVDSFFRASYVYTFGNVIPFLCKLDYLCFFLSLLLFYLTSTLVLLHFLRSLRSVLTHEDDLNKD